MYIKREREREREREIFMSPPQGPMGAVAMI